MLIMIESRPVDFRGFTAMMGAKRLQCVKRIWRSDKGSSAVEFALVLPLFLLLMFGAADFGFVVYTQSVMFNAAREAARRMAVDSTHTTAQAQSDAQGILNSWPVASYTITPERPPSTCIDCVKVTVSAPMSDAALLGDPFNMFSGTITAQVTMRQET